MTVNRLQHLFAAEREEAARNRRGGAQSNEAFLEVLTAIDRMLPKEDAMAFDNRHDQPGRRFAKGATRDDILLGTFGFVSHLFFFMFLGGLAVWLWPDAAIPLLAVTGIVSAICLFVRGKQVGASTTKESIAAIKDVF
jgi:hypothetical protein